MFVPDAGIVAVAVVGVVVEIADVTYFGFVAVATVAAMAESATVVEMIVFDYSSNLY